MTETLHVIRLTGCAPTPLASYLKALAVLRLVSEQADADARGWWDADTFVLRSRLDEQGLMSFFLHNYSPTPVVAPWNGGSGFYPNDARSGIDAIRESTAARLAPYRDTIACCVEHVGSRFGLEDKPSDEKDKLLQHCRGVLSAQALPWLDAAYVIGADRTLFPPLLGTGGNDGRLDFSNNFMQRLCDVIDTASDVGAPTARSEAWLANSLLDVGASGLLQKKAIGQFMPGGVGGANATTGYDGESLTNPWDFILMIEGTMLFGAATSRRLSSGLAGALAYPFTVRSVGTGHGSLADSDATSARAETWLPLWHRPCAHTEVAALLSEGRVQVSRRVARDGLDFARAVARLGVDRGITSFERVGYLQRNGLSFLAVPLGRWQVSLRPETQLLDQLDGWMARLRRCAEGKNVPARFGNAVRGVEDAILNVCRDGGRARWQHLLIAIGVAQRAMVSSPKTTQDARLRPLTGLGMKWLAQADDHSSEFRLACALASVFGPHPVGPLRANLMPLEVAKDGRAWAFADNLSSREAVWGTGDLVANLLAVLHRRCLAARRHGLGALPLDGARPASLSDVVQFVLGHTDDQRIADLLWGLCAIRWQGSSEGTQSTGRSAAIPAAYAILKLVHLPWPPAREGEGIPIRHDPQTLRLAMSGRCEDAVLVASRRLRSAGLPVIESRCSIDAALGRRIAAALLFPVSRRDATGLLELVATAKALD